MKNLRWRRKSFVHCHLMECNSRWNKTYDIQKRANLMRENTTFYISNKVGVYKTFYILRQWGSKFVRYAKIIYLIVMILLHNFLVVKCGVIFLINTCVNLHTHCFENKGRKNMKCHMKRYLLILTKPDVFKC